MKKVNFLKTFLKNPMQIGAILPSSQFLAREILKSAKIQKAKFIIELGSGTGVVTRHILKSMPHDCALLAFEIENNLAKYLQKYIKDKRVRIIRDSAEHFDRYLPGGKREGGSIDCIISGLPLAVLPSSATEKILHLAIKHLNKDGRFVQFQYSLKDLKRLQKFFPHIKINFEILNIPPAFIYICRK